MMLQDRRGKSQEEAGEAVSTGMVREAKTGRDRWQQRQQEFFIGQ
jgi:hypothetical protein